MQNNPFFLGFKHDWRQACAVSIALAAGMFPHTATSAALHSLTVFFPLALPVQCTAGCHTAGGAVHLAVHAHTAWSEAALPRAGKNQEMPRVAPCSAHGGSLRGGASLRAGRSETLHCFQCLLKVIDLALHCRGGDHAHAALQLDAEGF